jgi:5-methylcytosine-specific restriction endonuclease McrA
MKDQLVIPKNFGNFGLEPKGKNKRKPIKSKVRKEILYARRKCQYCRRLPAQHIHHMRGVAKGGSNRETNLVRLCGICHQRVTSGEITTEQLKRRLGIKITKRKKTIKRQKKRSREYSPLDAMNKEIERQNKIFRKSLF